MTVPGVGRPAVLRYWRDWHQAMGFFYTRRRGEAPPASAEGNALRIRYQWHIRQFHRLEDSLNVR